MWAECHPDICQGPECICEQKVSQKKPESHLVAMLQYEYTKQTCHPPSNYNTSMP